MSSPSCNFLQTLILRSKLISILELLMARICIVLGLMYGQVAFSSVLVSFLLIFPYIGN